MRFTCLLAVVFTATTLAAPVQAQQPAQTFTVEGDHFLLNGKPTQIVSGELHYARIPREYWRARLKMARAMGLNTIATYVFWNMHEPQPGTYDFSGQYDLAAFIKMAREEGLHVLLRAGPYACAEWDFGGFPAWLLKNPEDGAAIRANDPRFMVPAERWIDRLAIEMKPLLLENGGPILAVQVENEYGNFSNDHAYMEHMLAIFKGSAFGHSLLYTVDPSKALANGSLPGVLAGVNFGTGSSEQGLARLAALRPGAPLFATEYWPGWFDLFGHPHETRPIAPQLKDIENVLSRHGSINIYMFHGGTNFSMTAGASASTGMYRGNVTSYDYDAPLDEAGHPTPKFFAYRDVILKYTGEKPLPVPPVAPVIAIPDFTVAAINRPKGALPRQQLTPIKSETLQTMEQVGQSFGYILYRHHLAAAVAGETLTLDPVHDYAQVYVGDKLVGTLDRHYGQKDLILTTTGPAELTILVEETGRLNSTRNLRTDWKGLRTATLGPKDGPAKPLTGWEITSLPMADVNAMNLPPYAAASSQSGPHFAAGSFTLSQTGDSFLDVSALGKGLIWVNGHALGRFWNIGPQSTMYLPGPWLKAGRNEVVVFDLFPAISAQTLAGRTKPILDGPTPTYAADPERVKKAAPDAEFGPKLAKPATAPTAP